MQHSKQETRALASKETARCMQCFCLHPMTLRLLFEFTVIYVKLSYRNTSNNTMERWVL